MTAGEYGTGYADRLGNSAWRWIALFWARSAGGQCVRWCGGCRYCPDPLGFVLAEKGDGLPAARRLASPAGGGGTALAVTERAFSPHTIPHCCPLSRLRRQLSQRERQVGAFWLGTYVSGGFAVPHPSRLAASHLPLGGRNFGAVELGRCRGKPTLAAGAYPRKVRLLSPTY